MNICAPHPTLPVNLECMDDIYIYIHIVLIHNDASPVSIDLYVFLLLLSMSRRLFAYIHTCSVGSASYS